MREEPTDLEKPPREVVIAAAADDVASAEVIEFEPPSEGGAIRAGKLAGKSMWAAIWIVAVPVLLQQLMQACVGMVDKLLAGHLPEGIARPALDGLGVGTFVVWFVNIALMGLGVGGQAIIARSMGSGRTDEGNEALGQSMTLAVVLGAVVGVIMWFLTPLLATLTKLTPEAQHWCEVYVRLLALGMPFCGVMMIGTMCLHGAGEATKPLLIAILVNVINTVASWYISGVQLTFGDSVLVNPSPCDPSEWGVFGIAAGTMISYGVGAAATWFVLRRGVHDLRLEWRHLRPDYAMIWRMLRVGLPSFFEGLAMWVVQLGVMGFIGMASAISGDSGGLVGAHMITVQWEAFSFLPGFAMGTAAGAVAGQYLGAGNPRLARRAIWSCTLVGMAIMGTLGVVFITEGDLLTRFISRDPLHLEIVPRTLRICGTVQLFFALAMVVRNGLRGVGDTTWILWITLVSCWLIRLPAAYLFGVYLGGGLVGIWIGLCGELVIRGLLFLARFLWGNWAKVQV